MALTSILIPTFRRPHGLMRAVRSVFAQRVDFATELVIVDNSPEQGARDAVAKLAREAPMPVRFGHERRAGVSFARNALCLLAEGETLVWLDDDQQAHPGWLAILVGALEKQNATAAFGPVRAVVPPVRHAETYARLYTRAGPAEDGPSPHARGIGNCAMRADALGFAPFDARANETGGEDDRLFDALTRTGARFAWSARAHVDEHVDAMRLTPRHALKRAFAYGQGPCERAASAHDALTLARHMSVGAAQAAGFGAAAAIASLARNDASLTLAAEAARGAGKAIWFLPQRFYGAAAAATSPA
jgi:glycosyltransferase involved in cell wall biosynthesis